MEDLVMKVTRLMAVLLLTSLNLGVQAAEESANRAAFYENVLRPPRPGMIRVFFRSMRGNQGLWVDPDWTCREFITQIAPQLGMLADDSRFVLAGKTLPDSGEETVDEFVERAKKDDRGIANATVFHYFKSHRPAEEAAARSEEGSATAEGSASAGGAGSDGGSARASKRLIGQSDVPTMSYLLRPLLPSEASGSAQGSASAVGGAGSDTGSAGPEFIETNFLITPPGKQIMSITIKHRLGFSILAADLYNELSKKTGYPIDDIKLIFGSDQIKNNDQPLSADLIKGDKKIVMFVVPKDARPVYDLPLKTSGSTEGSASAAPVYYPGMPLLGAAPSYEALVAELKASSGQRITELVDKHLGFGLTSAHPDNANVAIVEFVLISLFGVNPKVLKDLDYNNKLQRIYILLGLYKQSKRVDADVIKLFLKSSELVLRT
jgi:hypothetical protein